jgi:hypothetical protein
MGNRVWTGPIADDGEGAWAGYHAETIVVSDRVSRRFGKASSWPKDDGANRSDDGIYWISDDALNEWCAEFWCIKSAPLDLGRST